MTTPLGRAGLRRTAPSTSPRHAASRFVGLVRRAQASLAHSYEVARTRRMLASLDVRALRDMGLTRNDIDALR